MSKIWLSWNLANHFTKNVVNNELDFSIYEYIYQKIIHGPHFIWKFELFLDEDLGGEWYWYKLTNSIDIDKFL